VKTILIHNDDLLEALNNFAEDVGVGADLLLEAYILFASHIIDNNPQTALMLLGFVKKLEMERDKGKDG
jgi:hypothetical protein